MRRGEGGQGKGWGMGSHKWPGCYRFWSQGSQMSAIVCASGTAASSMSLGKAHAERDVRRGDTPRGDEQTPNVHDSVYPYACTGGCFRQSSILIWAAISK